MAKPEQQFNNSTIDSMIVELFKNLFHQGVDFIKTEHLYDFDGVPGYSLGNLLGQDQ